MTDVRLTALNPEDSQVYPVACNTSGELKLEKQATFDGNLDGDLTVSGSASFSGDVQSSGKFFTIGQNNDMRFQVYDTTNDKTVTQLNGDGSASFSDRITTGEATTNAGLLTVTHNAASSGAAMLRGVIGTDTANPTFLIRSDGSMSLSGDVVIGSRSKQWMLVEQGGLCHMVEQVRATTADLVDPGFTAREYPKLRDVFQELNTIERCLEEVMTKLRMTEPDGWPVWDGSDNSR